MIKIIKKYIIHFGPEVWQYERFEMEKLIDAALLK
jgi:hypothetical protein